MAFQGSSDTLHGDRAAEDSGVVALLGFCPAALASSSIYVANSNSNSVSQYKVAPDGTLSPKIPPRYRPAPTRMRSR